jgi:hypothetical protein
LERLRRLLFDHPLVKAVGLGLFGILGNVLSGAYIFEITETVGGVQSIYWSHSLSSPSFWGLLVVLTLMSLYGWGLTRYETKIRKALTDADVLEIALQELLGPMIEAAKADIKSGRLRSMDDVKKMFGPGRSKK